MLPGTYAFMFTINLNINFMISPFPSPSGVTGPEQMYLLAIIDTYKQMLETHGALDERGVRFLLAVKIYAFVRRSVTGGKKISSIPLSSLLILLLQANLSTKLRSSNHTTSFGPYILIRRKLSCKHACHPTQSGLQYVPLVCPSPRSCLLFPSSHLLYYPSPLFAFATLLFINSWDSWLFLLYNKVKYLFNVIFLGVGYWVTNPTTLRGVIEKVAQAAFKARKDPGDCALFYLALNKKGALSVAYKSVKDQKLVDFLSNDFTQMRWKTAAAKNAYALQGKHR